MKQIIIFLFLITLFSCDNKFDTIFYIENGSNDQLEIPLRLIVDNDTIFDEKAKYSNITPDLQHIKSIRLSKGFHKITFEVPNTKLKRVENLQIDKNKYIFLSYEFKKSLDSLEKVKFKNNLKGVKNVDSVFSNVLNGRKPCLTYHVMEKEPIHH